MCAKVIFSSLSALFLSPLLGDDRAPVSVSGILLNPHGATGLQEVDEGEVASMQIQKA
jgi:hypothetical protein